MKKILLTILLALVSTSIFAQYDKDVFSWRGRLALQDGKYAQAIENFNVLVRLDTADYWSFFYRGIAKYNLGDIRGAQQDFDKSVGINPVFTNGYHYRAITKSQSGEYDDALRDLQYAIDLRPGMTGLYYSRGVTYFLAQRFQEAVDDFDRYIRKEPKDPGAFLNRGASYLFLGDTLSALKDYNEAIRIDRFDPEGYVRRGRLYAEMQDYESAINDMNLAIALDSSNTFAFFNRALMHYEKKNFNAAMADLDRVLKDEPGNALTLYNRSLINAQIGNYEDALDDIDRVININPENVLAYYNRAAFFMEMGRWQDALEDYDRAIELYPDFAKAYMNRSYVENMLGRNVDSKRDYDIAQKKVAEYRAKNTTQEGSFADTTKKYSSLIALDADFAKKDFNDELLQHRDIDIRLKPLYKFSITPEREDMSVALSRRYENALLDRFITEADLPISIKSGDTAVGATYKGIPDTAEGYFLKGLQELQNKQYSTALSYFNQAVNLADSDAKRDRYQRYYKGFYLMNRGVLRAEMIDFIASMENNVQTLTMDDSGATRARVSDKASRTYDYSEAIEDIRAAIAILPDIPYLYYDLGNLYCLSTELLSSLESYDKAISLYPYMGDAFYNRGLVLIYLKDKEKGCIDLSRAGELGIADAYSVISKYCKAEND